MHAALLRFVGHVERKHDGLPDLEQLEREQHVSFEIGQVDDVYYYVDLAALEKIHGDLLGICRRLEVVYARKVDDVQTTVVLLEIYFGLFYRDSGPVPYLEVLAGDLVEDGGLADVGVPRNPYGKQS
jgi:hypothetical protein